MSLEPNEVSLIGYAALTDALRKARSALYELSTVAYANDKFKLGDAALDAVSETAKAAAR